MSRDLQGEENWLKMELALKYIDSGIKIYSHRLFILSFGEKKQQHSLSSFSVYLGTIFNGFDMRFLMVQTPGV